MMMMMFLFFLVHYLPFIIDRFKQQYKKLFILHISIKKINSHVARGVSLFFLNILV